MRRFAGFVAAAILIAAGDAGVAAEPSVAAPSIASAVDTASLAGVAARGLATPAPASAIRAPAPAALAATMTPEATQRLVQNPNAVEIIVDVSEQNMSVAVDGQVLHVWDVSTARSGKYTPRGSWTAYWLSRHHRSSLYNNAPMPYAIFFNGDIAIHGTDQVARLGTPASAGCVRLHPQEAGQLFAMVRRAGLTNTRIRVVD